MGQYTIYLLFFSICSKNISIHRLLPGLTASAATCLGSFPAAASPFPPRSNKHQLVLGQPIPFDVCVNHICLFYDYCILLHILYIYIYFVTYGPRKAVAEVSKDKEPIGKERAEFNWFESQLMSDSNALRFN